jgi:PAS domain S-box-containing protein
MTDKPTYKELEQGLARAQDVIDALRRGEVDAVIGDEDVLLLRLRQVERTLRESRERLQLAVEGGELGTWDRDLRTGEPTWNDFLYNLLGRKRGSPVTGETFFEYVHPDDRDRVHRHFEETVDSREDFVDEFRIVRDDGEVRWLAARGRVYCDDDGRPLRMAGVNFDITDRKRAETALRRNEERFRSVIADAPVPVMLYALDGEILTLSRTFTEITGYSARDIPTYRDWVRKAYGLSEEEARKAEATLRCEQMRTDKRRRRTEETVRTKSGDTRTWLMRGSYVRRSSDDRDLMVSMALDVTDRKRAEEALRESKERYQTLFESIDQGFCVVEVLFDQRGKAIDYIFREINPAFEGQTGLKDAEGKRMRELAPKHEEHWFETYGRIALTGNPERFQNRAEQLHRWYDVYAFRIGKSEDRRVAILFNDITDRKRAEEALRRSEEKFHALFESMAEAFVLFEVIRDDDGRCTDCRVLDANAAVETMTGIEPEEVVGRTMREVFPDADPVWFETYGRVEETGDPAGIERKFKPLDRYYHTSVYRPAPGQVAIVFTDVTARVRAEQAIRDLARFPDENPNPVLRLDAEGRVLYANPAARDVLEGCGCLQDGKPPAAWRRVAREAREAGMLRRVEVDCAERAFDMAFVPFPEAGYVNVYGLDITLRKRAENVLLNARKLLEQRIETKDDELGSVLDMLQNATARRHDAEEQLRETSAVLERLFDNTHMLIAYLDRDFHFVRVNRAYADADGHPPDFFPGKNHFDLYPHPENEAIFRRVVETGEPWLVFAKPFEYQTHPERGASYWDWSLTPIKDSDGEVEGLILCLVDVTEEQRSTEQLERSRQQLRAFAARAQNTLETERTRIAADIHDELGQELTAFKTGLGMLARKLRKAETPADRDAVLERIQSMTDDIDGTVETVRRISTGLRPSVLDELGLREAIEDEVEDFSERSGVPADLDLGEGPVPLTQERSTAMFRIFQEALTNVERHADAQHVRVRLLENSTRITLLVADDGRGLPPERLAHSESLGLLGMRERAYAHGGNVVLSGTPGGGTTVRISFPAHRSGEPT